MSAALASFVTTHRPLRRKAARVDVRDALALDTARANASTAFNSNTKTTEEEENNTTPPTRGRSYTAMSTATTATASTTASTVATPTSHTSHNSISPFSSETALSMSASTPATSPASSVDHDEWLRCASPLPMSTTNNKTTTRDTETEAQLDPIESNDTDTELQPTLTTSSTTSSMSSTSSATARPPPKHSPPSPPSPSSIVILPSPRGPYPYSPSSSPTPAARTFSRASTRRAGTPTPSRGTRPSIPSTPLFAEMLSGRVVVVCDDGTTSGYLPLLRGASAVFESLLAGWTEAHNTMSVAGRVADVARLVGFISGSSPPASGFIIAGPGAAASASASTDLDLGRVGTRTRSTARRGSGKLLSKKHQHHAHAGGAPQLPAYSPAELLSLAAQFDRFGMRAHVRVRLAAYVDAHAARLWRAGSGDWAEGAEALRLALHVRSVPLLRRVLDLDGTEGDDDGAVPPVPAVPAALLGGAGGDGCASPAETLTDEPGEAEMLAEGGGSGGVRGAMGLGGKTLRARRSFATLRASASAASLRCAAAAGAVAGAVTCAVTPGKSRSKTSSAHHHHKSKKAPVPLLRQLYGKPEAGDRVSDLTYVVENARERARATGRRLSAFLCRFEAVEGEVVFWWRGEERGGVVVTVEI